MLKNNKIKHLFCILFFIAGLQNNYAQWVRTTDISGEWAYCFASVTEANGQAVNYQYAGTDQGVFISSNYGSQWTNFTTGLSDLNITSIIQYGTSSTLFASGYGGVFRSTNLGANWTNISSYQSGFTYPIVSSMVMLGSSLFAGTGSGVFLSSNNGVNWKKINTGLADSAVSCLLPVNNLGSVYLYAGTRGGVFFTPDLGKRWYPAKNGFSVGAAINSLAVKGTGTGTELYASTSTGLYKSTNFGSSWSTLSVPLSYAVNVIAVSGANVYIGTVHGVYRSANSGLTWVELGLTGEDNSYITSLAVIGPYLMAGTYKGGIWRYYLGGGGGVSVDKNFNELPKEFILNQNYPNPFNPQTNISYTLTGDCFVSLKIFDQLGREITTLVNEDQKRGSHHIVFSSLNLNLSSGVYYYKLHTGIFTAVKKMILVK